MSAGIPKNIAEVTNSWLSEIMGSEITAFKVTFLEGGVLSDAFKIHDIQYAQDDSHLPASIVLKLTNGKEEQRAVAVANGVYVREVRFFKELAEDVPLRTPIIYSVLDDGSKGCEFFSIAMEDLGTHSDVFDQVNDPPDEAYIRKINLEVAAFHGKFWESDALKLEWLRHPSDQYRFPMHDAAINCADNIATFVSLWEKSYGESPFQQSWSSVKPLTELICNGNAEKMLDHIYTTFTKRPWTLIHNDLRADNLFRTKGQSADAGELTYIDWQLVAPGPVGPEFTQSWQHSLAPAVRRKDLDFLKQYHERLLEHSPQAASYSYEMLIEDYRLAFILWWMTLMTLGAATFPAFAEPEAARMKALWGQGLQYMFQAMDDHDCYSITQKILAESR